jgi:hypothetical protein
MMTPETALQNLARVADNHLMNGPDRRIIDQSLDVLNKLVQFRAKLLEPKSGEAPAAPDKAAAPSPGNA